MATNDQVQKYYDSLISSYDVLAEGVAKSNERGAKVTVQFAQEVAAGQREALEFGKKLSSENPDMGDLYTALVEATTSAQARALAFSQFLSQEALDAGTESRSYIAKLVDVNRETSNAAIDLARMWSVRNPMMSMFRESVDEVASATKKATSKAS